MIQNGVSFQPPAVHLKDVAFLEFYEAGVAVIGGGAPPIACVLLHSFYVFGGS